MRIPALRRSRRGALAALAACLSLAAPAAAVELADQGPEWTEQARQQFYSQDQGSRIMPLAWMQALRLPDGTGFLDDRLGRYGYLPNPDGPRPELPVGFTVADWRGTPTIGMTCAACHTRQIEVDGTPWRIDGGPAIVDFQTFLSDLDQAVDAVLADDQALRAFAARVLGPDASETDVQVLRIELDGWHLRFHTLVERALPAEPWGPARLDAVSMIFNRLAGLDVGPPPAHLIADNIFPADAPTRYPFLWNAARQDLTQWPGFADNGNDILGLARNLGEVYGVFAVFQPEKAGPFSPLGIDYLAVNSANQKGLRALEDLIWLIGPPAWPFPLDAALAEEGRAIFERAADDGGCAECHGIREGKRRKLFGETWATPVQDVGTDTRECEILTRRVRTGVLEGARIPLLTDRLGAEDTAFNLLRTAVLGTIVQSMLVGAPDATALTAGAGPDELPPELEALRGAFRLDRFEQATAALVAAEPGCAYEARVLQGIWAAAPYLHNGSVPSLAELLKPPAERTRSFQIGPAYDIEAVGLAASQTAFGFTLDTGCDDRGSGNSNCGHAYGTGLSEADRRALLEYLKSL